MKKILLKPFVPAPWAPSGHLQTYLSLVGTPLGGQVPHRTQMVQLSDGDQILLRISDPRSSAVSGGEKKPVCLLFHGLGGDSESSYMLRIASKLNIQGFPVVRFNHRGCAPEARDRARQIYHAGRIDDMDETLRFVAQGFPQSPLLAIGFSLSANMLLLFLAKKLKEGQHPALRAALAVNPPIDLHQCSEALGHRRNRMIDRFFTRNLLRAARQRAEVLGRMGIVDHTPPNFDRIVSLRTFDTYYTAPLAGYGSCEDYYSANSACHVLGAINRPTQILSAADDPIIPSGIFEKVSLSPTTRCHMEPFGGHLGYLSRHKTHYGDHRWLDDYVVHWVQSHSDVEDP